jgi:PadR family transcriptional regulator PadR
MCVWGEISTSVRGGDVAADKKIAVQVVGREASRQFPPMALDHIVLAAVAAGPAHGYAIQALVARILPTARPSEGSRIYAALTALERSGHLSASFEVAGRGRVRRVYRIRPKGIGVLGVWLRSQRSGSPLLRRALLIQMDLIPLGEARWARALTRKEIRYRLVDRPGAGESRLARLVRLRERAHLKAEIDVLRTLVPGTGSGEAGPDPGGRERDRGQGS